ncbi:MAG: hypothetical protein IKI75_02555 [Lachnospiraceae bacterium]|nr:hypothetical protein [Lachnospiraceae bacterium]
MKRMKKNIGYANKETTELTEEKLICCSKLYSESYGRYDIQSEKRRTPDHVRNEYESNGTLYPGGEESKTQISP